MKLLFPNENKYDHIILKVSQETGIPMSVIKGFIAVESGFNEKAYRFEPHINDASYGLLQILYQTAHGLGFRGLPNNLFDPETNIRYGSLFISKLHKKYPKIQDLIASYNMGYPRTAKNTTTLITKIYGKPQSWWQYANQPYVDKCSSYIAYFESKERHDQTLTDKLYEWIKKNSFQKAGIISENLIGELKWRKI